ncbi:RagB/SusD family nutrient uptake outer membrane protein [uncultured Chitinophaga sp.]|uniref:RagB/SusD family nutrient uptake outer membrane protein n=1 Tax=uncultured Chitinophaga sp. TaxID=339340 RepID=UPI0025DA66EF|nr:RagB/SusD family nutrient uptake outer membrane protein [uncultured Chitinophaga sp.]
MIFKKKITILLLSVLALSSCKKWLEVQPEDKFTEDMIYKNEQGFLSALNGVYIKMAENNLYGANLTMTTLDLFAQRYYSTSSNSKWREYPTLNYGDNGVRGNLESIWESMYVCIANLNRYVGNFDIYGKNLQPEVEKSYKGQALALRAFLHFDLLRMWGPVYNSVDSTAPSIPVYTKVGETISDFMPANQVIDFILKDIQDAEELLTNDSVKINGYKNGSNFRMNLYAVNALKARVLLYRGDKTGALAAAKEVIALQTKFPWVTRAAITSNRDYPDRVFGTEVLFGLYARNMYTNYNSFFNPENTTDNILAAGPSTYLESLFESQADYRYSQLWLLPSSGVNFRTLYKYSDVTNKSAYLFRFMAPLIRMSEMYMIAAECEPDPVEGLKYINLIRANRGYDADLTNAANLETEIRKEYMKEFAGEGQLWFFYKRKKLTSVASASSGTVSYSLSKYVFPLPDSETSSR